MRKRIKKEEDMKQKYVKGIVKMMIMGEPRTTAMTRAEVVASPNWKKVENSMKHLLMEIKLIEK